MRLVETRVIHQQQQNRFQDAKDPIFTWWSCGLLFPSGEKDFLVPFSQQDVKEPVLLGLVSGVAGGLAGLFLSR